MSDEKCPPLLKLHEFLDREMTVQDFQAIQDHVQKCKKCSEQLEELKALTEYLKAFMKEKAGDAETSEETEDCLKTETFVAYYHKRLSSRQREKVEEHLCTCILCRKKMLFIFNHLKETGGCAEEVAPYLTEKTQALIEELAFRVDTNLYCFKCKSLLATPFKFCPQCGASTSHQPEEKAFSLRANAYENKWLIVGAVAFITSFSLHRYFIQLLLLSALFVIIGFMERSRLKTFIALMRAWREEDDEKAQKLLEQLQEKAKKAKRLK